MRHAAFAAILAISSCVPLFAQTNSLGLFTAGQYTKQSPGVFVDQNLHIGQKMSPVGPSRAIEYCREIGSGAGCLMYIRTPVRSELLYPDGTDCYWPVTDTGFNVKFKFPLPRIPRLSLLPYVSAGAGAIMLNGGRTAKQDAGLRGSGLNGQGDILVGGGFDRKLSRSFGIRLDVTVVGLKQTGFSDATYRSHYTDKVQIAFGSVYSWGRRKKLDKK